MNSKLNELIDINSDIRFGKPVIKGTRISVADVLEWLSSGKSIPEIIEDYPQLSDKQIYACVQYTN